MLDLSRSSVIPQFFLYGEAPREVGDRFIHSESLDHRSRPNSWNIQPHAHENLSHIFFIAKGRGEMRAETRWIPFQAPCLLLVPAGVVHAFSFETDSGGTVLTLSSAYLRELLIHDALFADLFDAPREVPLGGDGPEGQQTFDCLNRIQAELAWKAPGQSSAVEANLLILLVMLLRATNRGRVESHRVRGPHVELVARFRQAIEGNYRAHRPLEDYAQILKVTRSKLRAACLRVTGNAPQHLIHDRIELEAKRLLVYSHMSVAEVAFYLGFEDPAYFSRFFTRRVKESPRSFRTRHQPNGSGGGNATFAIRGDASVALS